MPSTDQIIGCEHSDLGAREISLDLWLPVKTATNIN